MYLASNFLERSNCPYSTFVSFWPVKN